MRSSGAGDLPSEPVAVDQVDTVVATRDQLPFGVLMTGYPGVDVPTWLLSALASGLGGVCLYAENASGLDHARQSTSALNAAGPQALIVTDEEGGEVTRLERAHGSSLPGNAALGWLDDLSVTQDAGAALGRLVGAAGIDLNLAPCLDVASNPLNRVVGSRSFGAYTEVVSRHGAALLDGLHSVGVGGCVKHFPGHGDTVVDSHWAIPQIDVPRARLTMRDVAPFAANPGADAVMVGHIRVPQMGPDPASLSPWAYQWIRDLGCDTAPILTDVVRDQMWPDFELGVGEACVRALEAGADLCLVEAPMRAHTAEALADAVHAIDVALDGGRLDVAQVAAAVERNRQLVARLREMRSAHLGDDRVEVDIEALGREIASRALVVRGQPRLAPDAEVLVMDLRTTVRPALGSTRSMMFDALRAARRRAGHSDIEYVDFDRLAATIRTGSQPEVVLQTREPLGDPAEAESLAWTLSLVPQAVVVHTGMVSAAPLAARMICTHGVSRPNGVAAADVLVGAAP